MDPEKWQQFVQSHKGIRNQVPVASQQEITVGALDPKVSEHAQRILFNDGTYLSVFIDPVTQQVTLADPGTALKPGKDTTTDTFLSTANSSNPYIVKSTASGDLTSVPNPNYQQEATVPSYDQEGHYSDQPVSVAKYLDEQKQTAFDNAYKQAYFDWQKQQAEIKNKHEQGQLSLDQAKAAAAEANAKINQDLERQRIAIASRGNDIAVRGQDVSLRGQDIGFVNNLVNSGVNAVTSSLPFQIPEGGTQALNTAVNAIGKPLGVSLGINVPAQQFPYDPQRLAYDLANQALQGISPTAKANLDQGPGNGLPPLTLPARPGPA